MHDPELSVIMFYVCCLVKRQVALTSKKFRKLQSFSKSSGKPCKIPVMAGQEPGLGLLVEEHWGSRRHKNQCQILRAPQACANFSSRVNCAELAILSARSLLQTPRGNLTEFAINLSHGWGVTTRCKSFHHVANENKQQVRTKHSLTTDRAWTIIPPLARIPHAIWVDGN